MADNAGLAAGLDGIPMVADAAAREARFPLATRKQNQRVFRLDTGVTQRWSGSAWLDDRTPTFDVRRFGATGDGTTSDRLAIQAAITAATGAGGGVVRFPPGTYVLDTQELSVDTGNLWFVGAGSASWIKQTVNNTPAFAVADAVTDVRWSGLRLSSPSGAVTQLGRGVIYVNPNGGSTGVSRLIVDHCRLEAGSTCGIAGNKIVDAWVHHNVIDNQGTGEHGVYLSSSGGDSDGVIVESNKIISSGTTHLGVQCRGGSRISIRGNRITGFDTSVLLSVGTATTDSEVVDNLLRNATSDGINAFDAPASRCVIARNRILNAGRNGIRSDGGFTTSLLTANLIDSVNASGMRLSAVTNSDITGNRIRDCDHNADGTLGDDSAGIRLHSGNTGNTITGNSVTTSNVASYNRVAMSIAAGNDGNQFRANRFDAGRAGTYDLATTTSQFDALPASKTWDPPSVAAGAQTTTTLTAITGVVLGDRVTAVGFDKDLQGMQLTGYVSAAETVTVVLRNGTAGAIDLASGTLTVVVRQLA